MEARIRELLLAEGIIPIKVIIESSRIRVTIKTSTSFAPSMTFMYTIPEDPEKPVQVTPLMSVIVGLVVEKGQKAVLQALKEYR